jgi:hypothetical protein
MDLGNAPQRVLKTHSSDEIAHLFADLRSAPRTDGISIASRRQNPFDANAQQSRA